MSTDKPLPQVPTDNPSEQQQQQQPSRHRRFPNIVRRPQSVISLRRPTTDTRNGGQASNNGGNNPPHTYRSMLDVEENADRGSIKLRRLGSTTRVPVEPQNPHNVRSMLDIDDNTERDTQAEDFAAAPAATPANRERLSRFGRMRILGRKPKAGTDGNDQLIVQDEYDPSIVDMLDVVGGCFYIFPHAGKAQY